MADPWDAFGDEDDDDDNIAHDNDSGLPKSSPTDPLALYLTQFFIHKHHRSDLSSIRVRIHHAFDNSNKNNNKNNNNNNNNNSEESSLISLWQAPLERRGFQVIVTTDPNIICDVLIVTSGPPQEEDVRSIESLVIPGGLIAFPGSATESSRLLLQNFSVDRWDIRHAEYLRNQDSRITNNDTEATDSSWIILTQWPVSIQTQTCPWLSSHYDTYAERQRAAQACVFFTAAERQAHTQSTPLHNKNNSHSRPPPPPPLSNTTLQSAVEKLQTYGYCILPGLLDPQQSLEFGTTALQDLHQAADILKARERVHLLELGGGHHAAQEPASYRELSMREDLRMDLRHGPRLDKLRGTKGCRPWTITAQTDLSIPASTATDRFLRGHPVILEIVRRTMNPTDPDLSPGNFGRYNFGGSGPDGSFLDLRAGPVGAIISLPGSADQAIHADTPHLFENYDCLPAHYINVFTPGCAADPAVGQTAFVHGSHSLSFTAKHAIDTKGWVDHLVRPCLHLGDVLLFDCRVLHFGLANTSASTTKVERPLLYTNCWQHWFHDTKNWDDRHPIFQEDEK